MRKLNTWINLLFLFVCLGRPLQTRAEAPTKPAAPEEVKLDAKAEEQYRKGVALYKSEHYGEAVVAFESAYRISQAPRLLYNLGQAHRRLGHTQDAIDYFDEYLKREPNIEPERRAAVQGYIRELKEQLAAQPVSRAIEPPATPPTPPKPPLRERQPLYRKWWLWTAVGAVVVTGVVVGLAVGLQPHRTELTNYYDPTF